MTADYDYDKGRRTVAFSFPRARLTDKVQGWARVTDLRSHEPPRNSGEGTAVDGPMPLAGGDDADAPA